MSNPRPWSNTKAKKRARVDWQQLALDVYEELKGTTKLMTPSEFVEVVGLKLAVIGARYTSGDVARNVIAQGDGRLWLWTDGGKWMVR